MPSPTVVPALSDDFDVPVLALAVTVLELDPRVWEAHAVVVVGKVVVLRPGGDLLGRPVGPAGAVGPPAVPLLQELLVLAFELVVENDAQDAAALIANLRLGVAARTIDIGVMGQLARLLEPRVEHLPRLSGGLTPIRFEQISTSVRERHDVLVSPLQRDTLQQAGRLKVFQTLLRRPSASPVVEHLANVADLDDAEGRDGGEGVALPAIQLVGPRPLAHDLALGPARQVNVACEHPALVVSSARTIATTA